MKFKGLTQNTLFLKSGLLPSHTFLYMLSPARWLLNTQAFSRRLQVKRKCMHHPWVSNLRSIPEFRGSQRGWAKQSNKAYLCARTMQGIKAPLQTSATLEVQGRSKPISTPLHYSPCQRTTIYLFLYLFIPLKIPIGSSNKGIVPGLKELRRLRKMEQWTITRQPVYALTAIGTVDMYSCFTYPGVGRGHFFPHPF